MKRRAANVVSALRFCAAVLLCVLLSGSVALGEGPVIVSLGDSYSSGEGIEPFYGQEEDFAVRCRNQDWLAHRSEKSWPGMLTLPGVDGPMRDHRGENWFFAAASGAETVNLFLLTEEETAEGQTAQQKKKYSRDGISGAVMLDPQLEIFDELDRLGLKADYVTLTIGGNDIGFQSIVAESMFGVTSFLLSGETVEDKADSLWRKKFAGGGVHAKIVRVLNDISARAGSQARIIVAGYPRPLAPEGGGKSGFPAESAQIMNAACSQFNEELRVLVEECRQDGMNVWFVSVEEAFEGHGAYSEDPYINPVYRGSLDQDLKEFMMSSCYSMHPNEKGAEAYARCVQEMIDRLEAAK